MEEKDLADLHGKLVARALSGAWHADAAPMPLSAAELGRVAPTLLGTGAGALAWWRLRSSALEQTALAGELRQAYRLHTLQAAVHGQHREHLAGLLDRAGIAFLLCKGWSIARLYPEEGLRPYGDLDVCVAPADLTRTQELLTRQSDPSWNVDLHDRVSELRDRDAWAKARPISAGMHVMCPEDQLRHLTLHFVRHGGWRPLWLCDVAVALEAAGPGFDWDYFLWGERRCTDWALGVVGLAQQLLGARVPPVVQARLPAPAWLPRTVLREWGAARPGDSHTRDDLPIGTCWWRPWLLPQALRRRWPNALEAAWKCGRSPHGWQLGSALHYWLGRAFRLLRRRARATPHGFMMHEDG